MSLSSRSSPSYAPAEHSAVGPTLRSDPRIPLQNLSVIRTRMDSLQRFLSESVNCRTLVPNDQMQMVSAEIASAIHQIIVNGAALLSAAQPILEPDPEEEAAATFVNCFEVDPTTKGEIVEIDAAELLTEHIHFCEICGKGFKRDANLRMHMRAHGNQYKTAEALKSAIHESSGRNTRFSCPYVGCNRNKSHRRFRPLKSIVCLRSHFKRSHCPKMYSCNRSPNSKRWNCRCGSWFPSKDKLFGHMALFEGHMPAVAEEKESLDLELEDSGDNEIYEGLLDDFLAFEDVLAGSPEL